MQHKTDDSKTECCIYLFLISPVESPSRFVLYPYHIFKHKSRDNIARLHFEIPAVNSEYKLGIRNEE